MIQTVQTPVSAVARADLAEAEKSLTATSASEVASKDSWAQVTADYEVPAKTSGEELETLADATQVIGSKTVSLFQVSSFTGVHVIVDLKGFEVVMMVGVLPRGNTPLLFLCGCCRRPIFPSEGVDHGLDHGLYEQVAVRGFVRGKTASVAKMMSRRKLVRRKWILKFS